MFPVEHKMVPCHYQQLNCWHILSLPRNNVKDVKKDWSFTFGIVTVFSSFEDTGELLFITSTPKTRCSGAPQGECPLPFFSHMLSLPLHPV